MTSEEKIWLTTLDEKFKFVTIANDDILKKALQLCRDAFCKGETISICTQISSTTTGENEMVELCRRTASDGASIACVEIATGKVVAVCFNKIQRPAKVGESFFEKFSNECKDEGAKALMDVMVDIDARADLFQELRTDCILEVMFMMTDKDYRNKKLCLNAVRTSVMLANAQAKKQIKLPNLPDTVVIGGLAAMGTSNISQKVFRNAEFTEVLEVNTNELTFRGKTFLEILPTQPKIILVKKKVCL